MPPHLDNSRSLMSGILGKLIALSGQLDSASLFFPIKGMSSAGADVRGTSWDCGRNVPISHWSP